MYAKLSLWGTAIVTILITLSGCGTSAPQPMSTPTPTLPAATAIDWPSTIPSSVGPSVSPSPLSSPVATCATNIGDFKPTRLNLSRLHLDIPVVAKGLEPDRTFPVPLDEAKWQAAWWKDGANPGSGQGVVHLGVHTYSVGGKKAAAGNLLGNYANAGDVIELFDKNGVAGVCYKVTQIKTWSKAEVPIGPGCSGTNSVCRQGGPAGLAIEFCWDKQKYWGDHQWRDRRYVLATPIR